MSAPKFFLLLFPFILYTLYFILPSPAHAAALGSNNFNYLINGQTTLEGSVGHTIMCSIGGTSRLNPCLEYQITNDQAKPNGPQSGINLPAKPIVMDSLNNGISQGGALGVTASLMANLYNNPPADGGYYLASLGKEFGIVQPAYAQSVAGSGEGIIAPIYRLWQFTRNLAYAAFIIVIIVIGFMIMFRQRINPQTVVSIQQAIPSIIIGLAMVTVSYFVAALIIDLAFVGTDLVVRSFSSGVGNNAFGSEKELRDLEQNGNVFQMFSTAAINGKALSSVYGGSRDQFQNTLGIGGGRVFPVVIALLAGLLTWSIPTAIIGGVAGLAAPELVPLLLIVILLIALFIQIIRLVFSLIASYIQLLVLTVAGPFYILWGSIPGKHGAITGWIKALVANTLIFPAVFAAFLFAGLILGVTDNRTATLPLFGGVSPDFVRVLVAYGIILGSPAIPDAIRQAFKVQGPQGIVGAATGGFLAGSAVGNVARQQGYRNLWRGDAKPGQDASGPLAKRVFNRFPGLPRR